MVDNGIKPVYVFDGKPPDMKGGELTKRAEKREEASKQLALATDAGDTAEMDKLNRRLVKVNKTHTDECKRLLTLMGIPYVEVHSAVGYINSFHDIDIGNVFIHRPHVRLKLNVQH